MIKKLSAIIICSMFVVSAFSQARYFDERSTYTQHYLFPVLLNVGATGSGEAGLILNYKNQWAAFEGSPRTLTLSYDTPLANRLGFGALLLSDNNGALETTKAQASLSYTIDSPTNKLGFGLSTEYIQHKIGSINSLTDLNDIVILDRLDGNSFLDVSVGIYGKYNEKLTYGVALPSLLSSNLDALSGESGREIGLVAHVAYDYILSNSDVHIEPSVFIRKHNHVPTFVDFNLKASFLEERLISGLSYALGAENRLGFIIGTAVSNMDIYYSYNVSSHEFQDYNNGSHDLTISVNLSGGDSSNADKDKMDINNVPKL